MNLDLMTCRRFTGGIVFPPIALQRNDLTRLYSEITERYDYSSFAFLPDGARMAHLEDELIIQPSRVQITETVPVHFNITKEKALDLYRRIAERLGIRQYLAFGTKLIAFQPADGPFSSATFIEKNVLKIDPAQLDLLGDGRRGTGMRANFHKDQAIYELRIEPFFMDLSQIYIELDAQFPQPFTDLSGLEPLMDKAYGYLFKEVREFLGAAGK